MNACYCCLNTEKHQNLGDIMANITVIKSGKLDYDGEVLWTVTLDDKVIGTVRKDTTTTYRMSGRIRVGATIKKGWSWEISNAARTSVNMRVSVARSSYVETSKAKAVAAMIDMYTTFAARV
jgi:hypothetical protein